MEDMVPELQDYVSRGYLSKEEARAVAGARRDHEYRLKRKAPLLADFLRYIEYETAVDELVRARRRAMPREERPPRKGLADRAGERRIHFIYARACRKFRGDLSLWSSWLAFCAERGCAKKGGRVAAAALALHPREPALWAAAAAWEYGGGGGGGSAFFASDSEARKKRKKGGGASGGSGSNPAAARALMQRGLRACGERCDALWAEYLRLELAYAATLRERRRVLGLLSEGGDGKEERKGEGKGGDASSDGDADESESEEEDDEDDDEEEEELGLAVDGDEDDGKEGLSLPPPSKKRKNEKRKNNNDGDGTHPAAAPAPAPAPARQGSIVRSVR